MARMLGALLGASAIAFGLFWLMHALISQEMPRLEEDGPRRLVEFVRLKKTEHAPETRERKPPEPPPEPEKKPPPPKMSLAQAKMPQAPAPEVDIPNLDLPVQMGDVTGGLTIGHGGGQQDGELMPLVRIAPQYPTRAAMDGIEGWVKLEFTITESGEVTDVKVTEAKPRRVFDREAIRAIRKWRFKPKRVNGKPVPRRAAQVIDFKLNS
jgi:protein TonB